MKYLVERLGPVSAAIAGALRRLHQNLGHPPQRELIRHLRLGGAPTEMVEGAGKLECKTCASCSAPKPHRVTKPAALLDFNEAVALDKSSWTPRSRRATPL